MPRPQWLPLLGESQGPWDMGAVFEEWAATWAGAEESDEAGAALLRSIRERRRWDVLEAAAGAWVFGAGGARARLELGRGLVEQGRWAAALAVIEAAVSLAEKGSAVHGAGLGELGWLFERRYVSSAPWNAQGLVAGVGAYRAGWCQGSGAHRLGMGLVALAARAEREGIVLAEPLDYRGTARTLEAELLALPGRELGAREVSSLIEARLALEDAAGALRWAQSYVGLVEKRAGELAEVLDRLVDVWQLAEDRAPGRSVLPLLRMRLLECRRADLLVRREEVASPPGEEAMLALEAVFGSEEWGGVAWYREMLEATRGVARIARANELEVASGSGVLVRPEDLLPAWTSRFAPGELLLLTSSQVLGEADPRAVRPGEAQVTFETRGGGAAHRVSAMVLERPRLAVCLARLEPPVFSEGAVGVAATSGERRGYVMEHAGVRTGVRVREGLIARGHGPLLVEEPGGPGAPIFDERWDLLALALGPAPGRPGSVAVAMDEVLQVCRAAAPP